MLEVIILAVGIGIQFSIGVLCLRLSEIRDALYDINEGKDGSE